MARERGFVKYAELLRWLKTECGLGHGHANAIILYIQDSELAKKKLRDDARAGAGAPWLVPQISTLYRISLRVI